jgi:uncharacterized protein (TIGR02996 family)
MSISERSFQQAILENPHDDVLRLQYADWLEEQGDPRGEFVRLQVVLPRLAEDDPRLVALKEREQQLLAGHGLEWLDLLELLGGPSTGGSSFEAALRVEDQMEQFLERLYHTGVARRTALVGCSAEEVAILERRYGVVLPRAYTLFLTRMGHQAGELGQPFGIDLSYEAALANAERVPQMWNLFRQAFPTHLAEDFPTPGVVVGARVDPMLGMDFWFLRCEWPDDGTVIRFDLGYSCGTGLEEPAFPSLFAFLDWLHRWGPHRARR